MQVRKHVEKLRTVDAIQWTGDNIMDIMHFVHGCSKIVLFPDISMYVYYSSFLVPAEQYEWIVKMPNGGFRRYTQKEFNEVYETV